MPDSATTRWSLVLAARGSRDALGELCEHYRPVIIAFCRRHGDPQLAEDHAQAFLLHFLESSLHARADANRGSFRAFLYTSLRNYWQETIRNQAALKRMAGIEVGEGALAGIAGTEPGPEREFDRDWAMNVFARAQAALRDEATRSGKSALFDAVRGFLLEAPDPRDYTRIGAMLVMPPNTVAVAVKRLRERLRTLVRQELADTLPPASDLETEMDWLRQALRQD